MGNKTKGILVCARNKVYPGRDYKLWYDLLLCRDQETYTATLKALKADTNSDTSVACLLTFRGAKPHMGPGFLGTLVFNCGRMRGANALDIVAHECLHAEFNYLIKTRKWNRLTKALRERKRMVGKNPLEHPEEFACYSLGDMVRQVWLSIYEFRSDLRKEPRK